MRSDRRNRRSLVVRSNDFRAGSRRAGVVILVTAVPVVPVHEAHDGFERDAHVEPGLPRLGAAGFDLRVLGNGSGNRVGQLFREPVHDVIHSCSSSPAAGPGSGASPNPNLHDRGGRQGSSAKGFIYRGLASQKAGAL